MNALSKTIAAIAITTGLGLAPSHAGPAQGAATSPPGAATSLVTKAQVGVYFDVGRPRYYNPYYRPYRPYYGYGYRYYDDPPPVTYYETRPYVVERDAPPPPPRVYSGDPDGLARCASRFRSFNANTGTYVTFDGEVRRCPYL